MTSSFEPIHRLDIDMPNVSERSALIKLPWQLYDDYKRIHLLQLDASRKSIVDLTRDAIDYYTMQRLCDPMLKTAVDHAQRRIILREAGFAIDNECSTDHMDYRSVAAEAEQVMNDASMPQLKPAERLPVKILWVFNQDTYGRVEQLCLLDDSSVGTQIRAAVITYVRMMEDD